MTATAESATETTRTTTTMVPAGVTTAGQFEVVSPPRTPPAPPPEPEEAPDVAAGWRLGHAALSAPETTPGGRASGLFGPPDAGGALARVRVECHFLHHALTAPQAIAEAAAQRGRVEADLAAERDDFLAGSAEMARARSFAAGLAEARGLAADAEARSKGHKAEARRSLAAGEDPGPAERRDRGARAERESLLERAATLEQMLGEARAGAKAALSARLEASRRRMLEEARGLEGEAAAQIAAAAGPHLCRLLALRERVAGLRGHEDVSPWSGRAIARSLCERAAAGAP